MEYFIGTFLTVRDRNNMKSPVDCIRPLLLHAPNFPLLFFLSQEKKHFDIFLNVMSVT